MKFGFAAIFLLVALGAGCTTSKTPQTPPPTSARTPTPQVARTPLSPRSLIATNVIPGALYETGYYAVKKGDTFSAVSRQFQVAPEQLRKLNPGVDPNRLQVGQVIRVYERRVLGKVN